MKLGEKMKLKKQKIINYSILSFLLTIILTYLFFPRSILKEALIAQVQVNLKNAGIPIVIDARKLDTYYISGIELKNLSLTNKYDKSISLNLKKITLRLSLLNLFIGKLKINFSFLQNDDSISGSTTFSLMRFLQNNYVPTTANISLDAFDISNILSIFFGNIEYGSYAETLLLKPVFANSRGSGEISGYAHFHTDAIDKSQLSLNIRNFSLDFKNPSLGIPKQNFHVAKASISQTKNTINISPTTKFISKDFHFFPSGQIQISEKKGDVDAISLTIDLELSQKINNSFGFLIPQMLNCKTQDTKSGHYHFTLSGQWENLSCT